MHRMMVLEYFTKLLAYFIPDGTQSLNGPTARVRVCTAVPSKHVPTPALPSEQHGRPKKT